MILQDLRAIVPRLVYREIDKEDVTVVPFRGDFC